MAAPCVGPSAERRPLTVMFADLVGWTSLSARLDPEDLVAITRAYRECCAAEIERARGYVAQYLGDGILAYFGYPQAHEDDAERAIGAALALIAAVRGLHPVPDIPLQVRVGVATGSVVVDNRSQEPAAVGETPNVAARLQALAAPDTVVIDSNTARLVTGLFHLSGIGSHRLKGFAGPMEAWRVAGPLPSEGRFEARHRAGASPLVGRDEELGYLLRRWKQASNGEGQVVLLCGEAGIGKSRIVASFREQLGTEPCARVSCHCSPHHQNAPLHPVVAHLARAADLIAGEPSELQLDKLERLLGMAGSDIAEIAPLFADLLSIPTGTRYPPLSLGAQRRREKTLEALAAQIAGLSAQQPVLIVFEDVHWIDVTSLELLEILIDRLAALRAMLILTFRPEFSPPWTGYAHVTSVSVNRLSRRESGILAGQVAGAQSLPPHILDQILVKTDGVPLFIEELTKAVLESRLVRDAGRSGGEADPPPLSIPATLRASLMARLDRLAPVREVAQAGAAIGREFSHRLLAAALKMPDDVLRSALEQLVDAGLIFRRGVPPHATYRFKHALVQDAAYETLLRSKRQQIHFWIATALREHFPETAEAEPEILARHFTEAGLVKAAVDHWLRAGKLAAARSACKEAIALLTKALDLLRGLPDDPDRRRRELDVQIALGGALAVAKGQAATDTGQAFARARELAESLPEHPQFIPVLYGQYVHYSSRGNMYLALEITEELLRQAERRNEMADLALGHRTLGTTLLLLGRLSEARTHLEKALSFRDSGQDQRLTQAYIFAPRAVALAYLAMDLVVLGFVGPARERISEALSEAGRIAHPVTSAVVLGRACIVNRYTSGVPSLTQAAEALRSLAAEQGFLNWAGKADVELGWAMVASGEGAAGLARMRSGIAAVGAVGQEFDLPRYLGLLADAYRLTGQFSMALEACASALDCAKRTGERWFDAELHRLRGETLRAKSPASPREAAACFSEAVQAAQEQGAKLWELRAATSLARLCREGGGGVEARDLLAAVCAWFDDRLDAPDLAKARSTLDALSLQA